MLARTDILLNRLRQNADIVDANSLNDVTLINYMNDAQRTIQNIIFQSDKLNNVFTKQYPLTTVSGTIEYDLPSDVYAENSLISVWSLDSSNRKGFRYDKQSFGESATPRGYSVQNRKIIFSHTPFDNILLVYNYRLPILSNRVGQVESVAGQVITIAGASLVEGFDANDEYVTIVDKYGTIITSGHYIDSLLGVSLTVEGDITSVLAGHYIVSGKIATSHSCLPEECETFLKVFTERKALAHINSTKLANSNIFSSQERADIEDLFADKTSDIEYPVIVDYDFLDY